jgi:hypothetical protein
MNAKHTERTMRNEARWAKVAGSRGKWTVTRGFKHEAIARDDRIDGTRTKEHALTIARNWLVDA